MNLRMCSLLRLPRRAPRLSPGWASPRRVGVAPRLPGSHRSAARPLAEALQAMIRKLLEQPASPKSLGSAAPQLPAQFAWAEYDQLMYWEDVQRGEAVCYV